MRWIGRRIELNPKSFAGLNAFCEFQIPLGNVSGLKTAIRSEEKPSLVSINPDGFVGAKANFKIRRFDGQVNRHGN